MPNETPMLLVNYAVFDGSGERQIGTADVQLPDLEALTETVKGAGIAGEVDLPILGHFAAMTCTINWRVLNRAALAMAEQRAHAFTFKGSIENYDAGGGALTTVPISIAVRGLPKKVGLGKMETGTVMDTNNDLEIVYLKVSIAGKVMTEIDKFNGICIINGVDYLARVNADLGL